MAKPPKTPIGGILVGGAKKSQKPKQKPRKPVEDVVVRPTYGLVFDPSGMQSEILSNEQKAARDLYLRRVGAEAAEGATPREILEQSGYMVRGTGEQKSRMRGRESAVYASAADALDALEGAKGPVGDVLGPLVFGDYEKSPASIAYNPGALARLTFDVAKRAGETEEAKSVASATGRAARAVGETEIVVPGVQPQRTGITVSDALKGAGKGVGAGILGAGLVAGKVAPKLPVPSPASQVASLAAGRGLMTFGDVWGSSKDTVMRAAQKPNEFIDVRSKTPLIVPGAGKDTAGGVIIDEANKGKTSDQIQNDIDSMAEQIGSSNPFSPDAMEVMKNVAEKNGWDTTGWYALPLGERIYRAVNEKNDVKLFFRTLLQNVGEMAAVPASIPALVEASAEAFKGDPDQAVLMFRTVVEPYVRADKTYEERGFWPAVGEFVRDNPLEAITLFMSTAKVGSRAAGTAMRAGALPLPAAQRARAAAWAARGRVITVPGIEIESSPVRPDAIPVPPRATPRGVGAQAARETLEANRAIDEIRRDVAQQNFEAARVFGEQQKRFEETGEMVTVTTPPIRVGVAGKGAAGTAFTQYVRAPLARAFPIYQRRLYRRTGNRPMRLGYNEAQGAALETKAIITRALGEGASDDVKNRAAFNLLMSATDDAGTRITPGYVADFFRAELDDLRAKIAAKPGKPTSSQARTIARLEAAIARHDALDAVEVPEADMARLRAVVKPIGNANDQLFATALGIDVEIAKRLNVIRVVAMDKRVAGGLEEKAQARLAELNAPVQELVRIQERLQRRAFAVLRFAEVTGWGKYGPKRSKKAFRKAADQMFADLRRGLELARINKNAELIALFEKSIDDLSKGRLNAGDMDQMGRQLVADIQGMRLTPEQVENLPAPARSQYQAAERLAVREREAEVERVKALSATGVSKVTRGSLDYAEQRLAAARADFDAYNSLPNPDQKVLDRKMRAVEKEEKARDSRLAALTASETKRKLAKKRQERLDRAVLESGTGVMDTPEFRAVLDVSERFAVMEVKGRKDLMYSIARMRDEAIDDFVKRLEAQDAMPAAHVMQTPDFENIGKVGTITTDRRLDASARGFLPAGRFMESEGALFISAQETANYWDSLIKSTSEVRSAAVLQERLGTLVKATSVPFRFSTDALQRADDAVRGDAALLQRAEAEIEAARQNRRELSIQGTTVFREQLERIASEATPIGRADIPVGKVKVLNIMDPKARTPSERLSFGNVREVTEDGPGIEAFAMETLDLRSLDPKSPGVYYIMPEQVYRGIQNAIRDETFRISRETSGSIIFTADRIMRTWRAITLNVLPRTAINNTIGSMILAAQAGAGPRSMYYAWMAINGRPVRLASGEKALLPVPRELRQRYYEQLTDPIMNARGAFKPIAKWMNMMRYANGMSEDLGRLAVWYHKAYPEAMNTQDGIRFFRSAQNLSDKSLEMLEAMSVRDPRYLTLMDEFVEQSFDFLGDLHRGGPIQANIRIAVPFWQWYMHMLKLTFVTMPFRYPKRALFLQQLGEIGRDYQERYGVTVPWGESIVPFFTEVIETPGGPQEIVGGVDLGSWWPQSAVSVLGGADGDLGLMGFLQGSVAPMWTESFLILASLIGAATDGGSALELDDRKVLSAAKDEFGLPIEEFDSSMMSYIGNRLFRMFPLSPTLMSASGRASNAVPVPGLMEEKRYAGEQLSSDLRQQQRADVAAVIDDWRANLPEFLLKATLGTPIRYLQGRGPNAAARYLRDYQAPMDDIEDRSRAMIETLLERHGYEDVTGKNR